MPGQVLRPEAKVAAGAGLGCRRARGRLAAGRRIRCPASAGQRRKTTLDRSRPAPARPGGNRRRISCPRRIFARRQRPRSGNRPLAVARMRCLAGDPGQGRHICNRRCPCPQAPSVNPPSAGFARTLFQEVRALDRHQRELNGAIGARRLPAPSPKLQLSWRPCQGACRPSTWRMAAEGRSYARCPLAAQVHRFQARQGIRNKNGKRSAPIFRKIAKHFAASP